MNLITFDIITNFCNYDDMEAINNRKKSEKIGKRSYARHTDWNTISEGRGYQNACIDLLPGIDH